MIQSDNGSIDQFWATPVYQGKFQGVNKLTLDLEAKILEKEMLFLNASSAKGSLFFNSFSSLRYEQNFMEWGDQCVLDFYDLISPSIIFYLQQTYPVVAEKFVVQAWANIHRFGDWHGTHSHFAGGDEVASGVYWVRVPSAISEDENAGGRLILFDPRGPFFPERKKIIILPEAEKLIIFPAWLQHEVTPLKSDDIRISIAFDIKKT